MIQNLDSWVWGLVCRVLRDIYHLPPPRARRCRTESMSERSNLLPEKLHSAGKANRQGTPSSSSSSSPCFPPFLLSPSPSPSSPSLSPLCARSEPLSSSSDAAPAADVHFAAEPPGRHSKTHPARLASDRIPNTLLWLDLVYANLEFENRGFVGEGFGV
jgi:hypothetical protein